MYKGTMQILAVIELLQCLQYMPRDYTALKVATI